MGDAASRFAEALFAGGVASSVLARILPRITFEPHPVPEPLVQAWCLRLSGEDAVELARRIFDAGDAISPDAVPA